MTRRGQLIPVSIEEEMKTAYLDYAMSVIIGRALPDARDGLKPVHRRVLYAMYREGLLPGRKFAKCARVVGEVIGKYHPHGDAAVYDALVRLAQDFNMRYPLVEGQGNFGSIDGDPPAAYRYTEARLSPLAVELLDDLDKETVDFVPNFDETLEEPVVLPARLPNLLVNGAEGIAVGMATRIPPHNLREVCDALIYFLDHPDATVDELMRWIQGPDFPTGGIVFGQEQIRKAYETGRGIIRIRARMEVETLRRDKQAIVVTEIPYQTSKAAIIEEIARLVQEKKIEGIADIRDESNRQGLRVVIELKRGENPDVIMNQLYQHTKLEVSYGVHMLAIQNLQPRLMSLRDLLQAYVQHRREVILRRSAFELRQARARVHVLEGLVRALDQLDAVIETIRRSPSVAAARQGLMERFGFTEVQAQAILEMQLQRLTGLERQKLLDELQQLQGRVRDLEAVLADEARVRELIKEDLRALKERHGDARRSRILRRAPTLHEEDLIRAETVVVTATEAGYIKRSSLRSFTLQRRGGKGRVGMGLREEDSVAFATVASTLDYLWFFFRSGRVYQLRVHEIPEMPPNARGRALVNFLPVRPDEQLVGVVRWPYEEEEPPYRYVVMTTERGRVKRMAVSEFQDIPRNGRRVLQIAPDDRFIGVRLTHGDDLILLGTAAGRGLLFPEVEVRPQGRAGGGVRGIRLRPGDRVVAMEAVHDPDQWLLAVTARGYGKCLPLREVPVYRRGSSGVYIARPREKTGPIVDLKVVRPDDEALVVTEGGMTLLVAVRSIPLRSRQAGGVSVIRVAEGDRVRRMAIIPKGPRVPAEASAGKSAGPPVPEPGP